MPVKRNQDKVNRARTATILETRNNKNVDLDFLKIQYQVLSDRRINHNSLLWGTPSILFVAQSLLWSIALDDKAPLTIRCAISIISILVGVITLHSFERQRLMEIADAEQLYSIELLLHELNSTTNESPILMIHHTIAKRKRFKNGIEKPLEDFVPKPSPLGRQPAFKLWKFMFGCIMVITVLLAVYNFSLLWTYLKAYFNCAPLNCHLFSTSAAEFFRKLVN